MIADKSRRKWGKIGLARLTFRSLGRRIDYESATSKSRLHHDLRVSFSQKRMLKRKTCQGCFDAACWVGKTTRTTSTTYNNAFDKPCVKLSSLEFCHDEKEYQENVPVRACSLSGNSNKMRYPEEIPKTYRRKGIRQKRTKEDRKHEEKTAGAR